MLILFTVSVSLFILHTALFLYSMKGEKNGKNKRNEEPKQFKDE